MINGTSTVSGFGELKNEVLPISQLKYRTTIYIPISLHKATRVYCAKSGTSMTQLITDFLIKKTNEPI